MADRTEAWMSGLVLVWGTAFVSIKVLGEVLDPFQLTWFRYLPFLLIFGVWMVLRRRDRFALITGPDWIRFTVAGALAVLGYHLPLNWATSSLTAAEPITGGTAALLVALTPLMTMVFAIVIGQETLDRRRAGGALLAFAGVSVVLLLGKGVGLSLNKMALLALLSPLLWSGYSVLAKPLINRYGGLFVTGLTMCLGTAPLLPRALHDGLDPVRDFSASQWFWLAYLSLLATVAGYTIWNQALKRRSASEVTAYIFAVPVVATLAGWMLLGETVNLWFVLGSAMVLFGLWQIHVARRPAAQPLMASGDSP